MQTPVNKQASLEPTLAGQSAVGGGPGGQQVALEWVGPAVWEGAHEHVQSGSSLES